MSFLSGLGKVKRVGKKTKQSLIKLGNQANKAKRKVKKHKISRKTRKFIGMRLI